MKHGKKPTVAQRKVITDNGLRPENWLVVKDCPKCFEVVNRVSGNTRKLKR